MIRLKSEEDIIKLREGGKIIAAIHDELGAMVAPGVNTNDLDIRARELMKEYGAEPALLGYKPSFAPRPFPASICVQVNDVVEHGIPNENSVTLKEGDIVGIDITLRYKGMVVDSGRTYGVGIIPKEIQKFLDVTKEALSVGITAAQPGGRIGDISAAIEAVADRHGYGVVAELAGHGVGFDVHEEPTVPNFGNKGTGPELVPGLVIAIEPMFTMGGDEVEFDQRDGYTVRTKDGSLSSHFEHTVLITENGPEILTKK